MLESDVAIPCPVLFNTWKHHAATLRQRIAACADDDDLARLAGQLVVIGADLMDLYTGGLSAEVIAEQIVLALQSDGWLAVDVYRAWLSEAGGYRTMTLGDHSLWILRRGDEAGRYVHIHPGRGSPHTRRVRANVLKTAVLVLGQVRVHGGDPLDVDLINAVRRKCLGLSPIPALAGDQGLAAMVKLLGS